MSGPIATLSIDFAASVARLEKDIRGAAKAVQSAARDIDKATSFARNAIISMAGALGVVSFGQAIRDAGNAADAAAKMGDRFGLATEKMVGLQHAADLSGLANVENALKTMTEKVGEAANKSGEARDAMRLLGVSANELSKLPVDQQFQRMIVALEGVENVTQRNYIAQKLFSESAGGVLQMVANGADSIAQATRDTEAWGTALSRVDAAKIEMANDATTRAKTAMRGLFTTISVQVAPVIKVMADAFADSTAEAKGFKNEAVTGAGFIAQAIAYTANAVHTVRLAWAMGKYTIMAFFDAITQGVAGADRILTDWQNRLAGTFSGRMFGIDRAQYNKELQDFAAAHGEKTAQLAADVGALLDAGLPGDSVIAKITAIREQMDREAAIIAQRRQELGRTDGTGIGEDTSKADAEAAKKAAAEEARWQQDLARRLERIQLANLSESEIANQKYLEEQNTLDMALQNKLVSEDQYRQLSFEAERAHRAALGDLAAQGQIEQERFTKMTSLQQTQHVLGSLMQMTAGTASANKKMFQLNKTAAIANAIVNTYEGAAKAFGQTGIFGFVTGAAILAAGFAQVNAIRAQSFDGGGGSAAVSSAPSAAVTESGSAFQTGRPGGDIAPTNAQKAQAAQRPVNIEVHFNGLTRPSQDEIRDVMADAIREAQRDGVVFA